MPFSLPRILGRVRNRDAEATHPPVFQAPPLTADLIAAIKLISPQLSLGQGEASRSQWAQEQNRTCWGEYEALQPFFSWMKTPKKILEIGPGLGRSAVFFTKQCGWQESRLDLFDATGNSTKYKQKYYDAAKEEMQNYFCGNLKMLEFVLQYNQVANYRLFDAHQISLGQLPGPYDLIYSFYSLGFHWSLERFLGDLLPLMHETTVGVFTVKLDFRGFPALRNLSCRVVEWKQNSRKRLGMLLMSKAALPELGSPLRF